MKNIKITFDTVGERALSSYFDHIEHVPDSFEKPFRQMARDFREQNLVTFESEGPGWRPLAPSTLLDKQRKGYGGQPILVRNGTLKRSLTEENAPLSVLRVFPQRIEMGTSVRYAMYHQTGNIKSDNFPPDTHPPRRKLVNITPELQKKWNRRLITWLRDEFGWNGG